MTHEKIRERICKVFDKMNIEVPQSDTQALELDSVVFMMVVYEFENEFSVKFNINDFSGGAEPTLESLIGLIVKKT